MKVGVITRIIGSGNSGFGFVHICQGPEVDESTVPRIYFKNTSLAEGTTTDMLALGYNVTFLCKADSTGRAYADDINVLSAGLTLKSTNGAASSAGVTAAATATDNVRSVAAEKKRVAAQDNTTNSKKSRNVKVVK